MLSNFVRRPRFEPATTGLSGKIHTHLTTVPSTWFIRIILWYIMVMTADYQIRAWSSYASWSLFCRRFVDIQQSFSCIFRIKDGNDFSQFRPNWGERNPMLRYLSLQIIHYFTRYADANQLSRGLPLSSVADKSHVHTRIELSVVFKIIFQDLIHWTEMFV